jgi:uncharacterized protein YndB with AHSA1/START domain
VSEHQRPAIEASLHSEGVTGIVRMKTRYVSEVVDVWSALTEPARLAHWYGTFEGGLHLGGDFTAFVPSSGWDGRGHIDVCVPREQLSVTMWETVGEEQFVTVELFAVGDHTDLRLEKGGVASDLLWAYGCGWHAHLEDLADHLTSQENPDWPASWNTRFDELEPLYRSMGVTPIDS